MNEKMLSGQMLYIHVCTWIMYVYVPSTFNLITCDILERIKGNSPSCIKYMSLGKL